MRGRLVELLAKGRLQPVERANAGNTLAQLGDPRFREDAWFLPDDPLLGFVEIPNGQFLMGSDKKRDSDALDEELPQHEVTLPTYYLARYPVTVAQFRAFVEDAKYKPADSDCLRGLPNHPVVWVSWADATAYCEWLTGKLQQMARRTAAGPKGVDAAFLRLCREDRFRVTLPSEAEWEKAARGADGRIYLWGDEPDPNCANYDDTGINATSPVGCFPEGASPYGCLDMSGNVWEWTRSLWGKGWEKPDFPYPYDAQDGREKLKASDQIRRVLRGGSFLYYRLLVRCAVRLRDLPISRLTHIGFRLCSPPL